MPKKSQQNNLSKMISEAVPSPSFEFNEQQLQRMKTIGEVALGVSILAGTIALTILAPNIFIALDKIFGKKQYGSKKNTLEIREQKIKKSFYYMRNQGYINIEKKGELIYISPTKKGLKRLNKINFKNLQIKKTSRKKGEWWVVMADIPTKEFRSEANLLQKKLKEMLFYPLQRTVWIHPFDPRIEVEAVAVHYKLSPFITMMQISKLDPSDEEKLNKFFKSNNFI